MKNFITLCIFFVFLFNLLFAEIVITDKKDTGITYTFGVFETPGISEDDPKKKPTHEFIEKTFHEIRRDGKFHPISFESSIANLLPEDVDLELLCVIDGDLEKINKNFKKEGVCTWVWKGVDWNKVCFKIELSSKGVGLVSIMQENQLVGSFVCHSSTNRNIGTESCQPFGKYSLLPKVDKDRTHKNYEGTLMENARCFDSDRGLYIHLGQITASSHGCLRVSRWWSETIFEKAPKGLKIEVIWLN